MTTYKFINFFRTELVQGITSISNVMLVPQSDAAKLPFLAAGEAIRMAIWDGQQDPEIVDVTENLATGQLPISRAKEATTAKNWPAGTQVTAIISAELLTTFMASYFDVDLLMQSHFLPLTGGTMVGPIRQALAPVVPDDLANKAYVDANAGDFVNKTGDIMSGDIDMATAYRLLRLAHPLLPDHAATKNYVDLVLGYAAQRAADDSGTTITTGTGAAFVGATSYAWPSLVQGISVTMRFHATNAANATFQLNALAAKPIAGYSGANLAAGKIVPDVPVRLTYIAATDKWHVHNLYSNDLFPGDVKYSGQTADHGAWILCDGRSLDRTLFATLFAAIGTTYGSASGTTFNIPDLRGRVPVGKDDMGGSSANRVTAGGSGINGLALGAAGGGERHQLTLAEIPNHNHALTEIPHTHQYSEFSVSTPGSTVGSATAALGNIETIRTSQPASTGITIAAAGGGGLHNNMQPSLILNAFIHI